MKITKEKFLAYESVREDGETNMFAIDNVINLALERYNVVLTKDDCLDIMNNYGDYKDRYLR